MDPNNTRRFTCPCCNADLKLEIATQITVREYAPAAKDGPIEAFVERQLKPSKDVLARTAVERQVLYSANKSGLIDALTQALSQSTELFSTSMPKDVEQFFLNWLRAAKQKMVPPFALSRCLKEFGGRITFIAAQQIIACLSDGKIRCFMPMSLVAGAPIRSITSSNLKGRVEASELEFDSWIRTKHGYVAAAGSGMFLDEMRKKSRGEFANPVM